MVFVQLLDADVSDSIKKIQRGRLMWPFKHRHYFEEVSVPHNKYKEIMKQLQELSVYPWYKQCKCGQKQSTSLCLAFREF